MKTDLQNEIKPKHMKEYDHHEVANQVPGETPSPPHHPEVGRDELRWGTLSHSY